jgi:hypothetical protein
MTHRVLTSLSLPFTLAALAVPAAANAYDIKPPWRGDSLPHGVYMQTRGHGTAYDCPDGSGGGCAMDIKAVRFDSVQGWTEMITTASADPAPHSDFLSFGVQLYSPVDGDVIGCWQNMPEELANGDEPPECAAIPGGVCAISGNHLLIRTDDGHVLYLAHLQTGSLEPGLCPFTDEVLTPAGGGIECIEADHVGLRNDARIDKISPFPGFPRVKKGDPLAKIGASGAADNPHLHLGVYALTIDELGNPCLSGEPYEFTEAWSQERPSGEPDPVDWTPLVSEELFFDDDNFTYLLWGDPLGPRVDELDIVDGTAPALAMTSSGGVAAYRNTSGELEVNAFNFDVSGGFDPGVADDDLLVSSLDIARINSTDRHAVAAVINSATKLAIVPVYVKTDADVIYGTTRTESTAGAQLVRATPSPVHSGIVAAIKNSGDGVSVVNYKTSLSGTTLSVTRESSAASADTITDLDVATVVAGRGVSETTGAFKGVVTAERRSNDTLWLQSWQLNSTGTTMTLVDEEQVKNVVGNASFTVSDVDVTVTGSLGGREFIVVSAALASGGNLRVQSWEITSAGQLGRIEQYDGGGPVSQLSSSRAGLQDVAVGMRLGTTSQTVLSFHVTSAGALRRVGTWDAENLSALAVGGRSSEEDLVALYPDPSTGDLRLAHYVTNYAWSL